MMLCGVTTRLGGKRFVTFAHVLRLCCLLILLLSSIKVCKMVNSFLVFISMSITSREQWAVGNDVLGKWGAVLGLRVAVLG